MRQEQSYGIVPLKKAGNEWRVFMVRHQSGHWTLPKGHVEEKEAPLECAERELFEETGLKMTKLLFDIPLVEKYQFSSRAVRVEKTVDYFIAEVEGKEELQIEEIQEGRWVTLFEAQNLATYQQMKTLLGKVVHLLPTN